MVRKYISRRHSPLAALESMTCRKPCGQQLKHGGYPYSYWILSGHIKTVMLAHKLEEDLCQKELPISLEDNSLQRCQIDYIGPLPQSERARYALTCVDTVSGLKLAYLAAKANQVYAIKALIRLLVSDRTPEVIESDQGTHFTGAIVQKCAKDNNTVAVSPTL